MLARSRSEEEPRGRYLIVRDLGARQRLLLIEDTDLGNKLVDLTVVGEHGNERTWRPRLAVAVNIGLVGTIDKSLNDGVEDGLH